MIQLVEVVVEAIQMHKVEEVVVIQIYKVDLDVMMAFVEILHYLQEELVVSLALKILREV